MTKTEYQHAREVEKTLIESDYQYISALFGELDEPKTVFEERSPLFHSKLDHEVKFAAYCLGKTIEFHIVMGHRFIGIKSKRFAFPSPD